MYSSINCPEISYFIIIDLKNLLEVPATEMFLLGVLGILISGNPSLTIKYFNFIISTDVRRTSDPREKLAHQTANTRRAPQLLVIYRSGFSPNFQDRLLHRKRPLFPTSGIRITASYLHCVACSSTITNWCNSAIDFYTWLPTKYELYDYHEASAKRSNQPYNVTMYEEYTL